MKTIRVPFFYGWVMLPVAIAAQIATTPGQTFGVSVFNQYFRDAFSISHSQLTGTYMAGTFVACLPVFFIGAMMDRYGIRRIMTVVVILLGGACILTSQMTGLVTLFISFVLLRVLGHGALPLLADNTLAMWFHRRLGVASGLKSLGIAVAMGLIPPVFLWLIRTVGWRWAYAVLGLTVWIVMLPVLAVLFRNRPEDIGQFPDGIPPESMRDQRDVESSSSDLRSEGTALDLRAALRTRAYWIMLTMHAIWAFVWAAIIFNIIPLFQSRGLSEDAAVATFVPFALAMAAMQVVGGILADRLPLNVLMSIAVAGVTVGVALIIPMRSEGMALAYAITFGAGQGLAVVVGSTVWVRYFGRDHLGKIRGTVWTSAVAGSSLGPFLMGAGYDWFGSYDRSLWILVGLAAPLIVATLFATPPGRRSNQ